MTYDFEQRKKIYEATEAWQRGGDRVAVLILRDLSSLRETAFVKGRNTNVAEALLGIMKHSREFAKHVLSAALAYEKLHGEGPQYEMDENVS